MRKNMADSYTFGNCIAYHRQDRAAPTWCVLRGNADIGVSFERETQACLVAALIEGLSDEQWGRVRQRIAVALKRKEAA